MKVSIVSDCVAGLGVPVPHELIQYAEVRLMVCICTDSNFESSPRKTNQQDCGIAPRFGANDYALLSNAAPALRPCASQEVSDNQWGFVGSEQ